MYLYLFCQEISDLTRVARLKQVVNNTRKLRYLFVPDNSVFTHLKNYLQKLFKINKGSKNQHLDYTSKLRNLRARVLFRGFLVGFFLIPWVFVWGFWILLSGLIIYLVNTDYITFVTYRNSLPYPIAGLPKGYSYEWYFLVMLGLALLTNYSISFFSYRKNPALGILMYILSIWLILIAFFFVYLVWQFNSNFLPI